MDSRADVRSAADDLPDARADVDLANAQFVGIGMAFALFDVSDNDAVRDADRFVAVDFQPDGIERFEEVFGTDTPKINSFV